MGDDVAGCTPLELAALAGLAVIDVPEEGVLWLEDPALWVGPGADGNVIATIACRRMLAQTANDVSEEAVRAAVEEEGYAYDPRRSLRPLAATRPPECGQKAFCRGG